MSTVRPLIEKINSRRAFNMRRGRTGPCVVVSKTTGEGLLAVFDKAESTLTAGVDAQHALE